MLAAGPKTASVLLVSYPTFIKENAEGNLTLSSVV
jgi:hypothetical protein